MGFSLLLFSQPPLLISDVRLSNLGSSNWSRGTISKEVTLSVGNELADLVGSNPVGLRVVAFEEVSWICRLHKNEVALEMARMEAICRVRNRSSAHDITRNNIFLN